MTFEDEHDEFEEGEEHAGGPREGDDDGFPFLTPPPRERKESDHKDKIPALILAARKARDDDTKLLLLQKAKQIDPAALEPYLLRAAIFAKRGDDRGERAEYQAALTADPTHWFVRFQLLNLEYPVERDLKHACGIVRDLAWEKGVTERFLNAGRGKLRSESELSHDEAVLGHIVLAGGGGGHGVVDISRVAASRTGDALVLNALEPWLERFDKDGSLVFGTDLWLADDVEPIQEPCDAALCEDGSALVCASHTDGVWRLEPDGSWVRRGLKGVSVARPVAIAAIEGSGGGCDAFVLCGERAEIVRASIGGSGPREAWSLGLPRGSIDEASIAASRDGTAYALVDGTVYVLPRGGAPRLSFPARPKAGSGERSPARGASGERAAAGEKRARGAAAAPPAEGSREKGPKGGSGERTGAKAPRASASKAWQGGGIAVDPTDGTLLIADAGRDEVVRLDAAGALLERICDAKTVKRPADVAVDGAGRIVIADQGHARAIARPRSGGDWTVLFGGAGLLPPKPVSRGRRRSASADAAGDEP